MKNTKLEVAKPTDKEINFVITNGVKKQDTVDKITDIIRRDALTADDGFNTQLSKKLTEIVVKSQTEGATKNDIKIAQNSKRFVKTQVQTLIKMKSSQDQLNIKNNTDFIYTFKKVNKPMLENNPSEKYPTGRYVDHFTDSDEGQYKLVRENRPVKPDVDEYQAFVKFCENHEIDGEKAVEFAKRFRDETK